MGSKIWREDEAGTGAAFPDFSRKQQAQLSKFCDYLNASAQVLDHEVTAAFQAKAGDDTELTAAFQHLVSVRLSPLVQNFARAVLVRGLYAALDDQPEATVMTAQGHGLTLSGCRTDSLVTFDLGCIHKDNLLRFVCVDHNPCSLSVQAYRGTYAELNHLVGRSAKLFADASQGYACLKPVSAGPAAV